MDFYQNIPKIELHIHLEGSIPLQTLWLLMEKYGGDSFVTSFEELQKVFFYKNFDDFIKLWVWKNQFLREYEDFTLIAEAVAADLSSQNIRYAEMFFSPSPFKKKGLKTEDIIIAVHKGLSKVTSIKIKLIVDLVRDFGPQEELITLSEINEVKEYGILGIGIGGTESAYPPHLFQDLYEKARTMGFKTTVHAGEAAGVNSIWEAINTLHPDRIGHGTKAVLDENLLHYLAHHQLPLELCPLSNVKTKVITSYEEHPLLTYYDYGIPFSINTDDPKMFNISLTEEYQMLEKYFGFTREEVVTIIINSIKTTWLSESEKLNWIKLFQEKVSTIFNIMNH